MDMVLYNAQMVDLQSVCLDAVIASVLCYLISLLPL